MHETHIMETLDRQDEPIYLREAYGERAIREMELALLKAREALPKELDNHPVAERSSHSASVPA